MWFKISAYLPTQQIYLALHRDIDGIHNVGYKDSNHTHLLAMVSYLCYIRRRMVFQGQLCCFLDLTVYVSSIAQILLPWG